MCGYIITQQLEDYEVYTKKTVRGFKAEITALKGVREQNRRRLRINRQTKCSIYKAGDAATRSSLTHFNVCVLLLPIKTNSSAT